MHTRRRRERRVGGRRSDALASQKEARQFFSDLRGDLGTAHDASHRSHGAVHGPLEVLELLLHQQAGDLSDRSQAHARRERQPSIPPLRPLLTSQVSQFNSFGTREGEKYRKMRSTSAGLVINRVVVDVSEAQLLQLCADDTRWQHPDTRVLLHDFSRRLRRLHFSCYVNRSLFVGSKRANILFTCCSEARWVSFLRRTCS